MQRAALRPVERLRSAYNGATLIGVLESLATTIYDLEYLYGKSPFARMVCAVDNDLTAT